MYLVFILLQSEVFLKQIEVSPFRSGGETRFNNHGPQGNILLMWFQFLYSLTSKVLGLSQLPSV